MGIANRDYYREPPSGGGGFFDWTPGSATVCKRLIAVNVIVFLLQIFLTRSMTPEELRVPVGVLGVEQNEELERLANLPGAPRVSLIEEWGDLNTTKVLHGQIWRLATFAFCHDRLSVWHILFNMLFLWWFGKTLESMYGPREFLLFYMTAAVVSGLAFIGLQLVIGDRIPCIGASGAVMAVLMLFAIHFPRDKIYIFMLIPVEVRWVVALYVIIDLHPVLLALAGQPMSSGVAHAAHLGGLAFGFVYWKRSLRLEPIWDNLRQWRLPRWFGPRRNIRLFKPRETAEDDLDELVDKILVKIHEHGEKSLTEVEREVLRVAGQKYRRK